MKNLPEKTPPSTGLPADSNGASVNSTFHGAASASAPSSSPGGSPLSLSDLPCTPRAAFGRMSGKRADLLLTADGNVEIECGTVKPTKRPELGEYPLVVSVWMADAVQPHMIVLGGLN